jgi:hypothetical protein
VETGSGNLDLVYLEDSTGIAYSDLFHWFLKTGSGYRIADTYSILTFVDQMEALEWADVVSYKADGAALTEYGLSSPAAVLAIDYTTDGGSTKTDSFVLELGSYDSDGNCYARLRGSSMVYLIDGASADSIFQMSNNQLLPDEVCYMNMDELLGLDILLGGETYHIDIDRSGTSAVYTWDGKQLDGNVISAFLNNVKNLKSSGAASAEGDTDGEALGLTFYRDAGDFSEMTLRFLDYDGANYLVDFAGAQTQLAAGDVVDGLFSTLEGLFKS